MAGTVPRLSDLAVPFESPSRQTVSRQTVSRQATSRQADTIDSASTLILVTHSLFTNSSGETSTRSWGNRDSLNHHSVRTAISFTRCCLIAFVLSSLLTHQNQIFADVVKFKGGGELRGVFLDPVSPGKKLEKPLRVETLTGGIVIVETSEIELVARRSRPLEEYEWKTRLTEPTVAGHWELQEWCRQNQLRKEREIQLAAVIELEPGHAEAHKLLGHLLENGKWMTRDQAMIAKGYVKYKGKYLFPQEVELLESSAAQRESSTNWYKKLYTWREWLHGGSPERQQQALAELRKLSDVDAVSPLIKLYRNEPMDEVRLVFVRTLGKLGGHAATQALVLQSLFDTAPSVRAAAMESIPATERDQAIPIYLNALKDEVNEVILRAAVALGYMGDQEVVPALIDSLVTVHSYKVKIRETGILAQGSYPDAMSTPVVVSRPVDIPLVFPGVSVPFSTSNPGSVYNPGNMGASTQQVVQTPPQVISERIQVTQRPHQNVEVLAALRKLTNENFGYDQRTWKLWWTSRSGN